MLNNIVHIYIKYLIIFNLSYGVGEAGAIFLLITPNASASSTGETGVAKVDGVYTDDPVINTDATRYDTLSYKEVIEKELRVMDLTAITLCKENSLPIIVFDIKSKNGLLDIINSIPTGTTVS